MKILIIGAGGVGGYFGAQLARTGLDVSFLARGDHKRAIEQNGLQIKSIKGDFTVHPRVTDSLSEAAAADLIILATKSWQIEALANQLKDVLHEDAMVLPLQNGADNADRLRTILKPVQVLAGLCKIVSKIEAPGVINHFMYEPQIVFSEYDSLPSKRVAQLKELFDLSGIKNFISKDIKLDIWRKFLFIASVSGLAALTRVPFGVLQNDASLIDLLQKTALEIRAVANAKGIGLTQNDIETAIDMFMSMGPETTASMQRDILEGKPSELENFNGYIVKEGLKLGVDTPINAFTYHSLLPQERQARKTL